MQFSHEEVLDIAGDNLIESDIKNNPDYEWIDIVGIPQRPVELKDNLYFATHSDGESDWNASFDRRPIAERVSQDKGWYLALEPGLEIGGQECLRVRSLDRLATQLYEFARERTDPYIVGVTGSVGKTTTVAFLEHLLAVEGRDVSRFYSKRLTPLSVMCHYVNRVDPDTAFVVMEYSAYMEDHVHQLSELLAPNIAFLTNIYDTHINPGMFENKEAILKSKLRIKADTTLGIINTRVCDELNLPIPDGWKGFSVEIPPANMHNPILPPTLRTAEMYTVGKLLASDIGIFEQTLKTAYETFSAPEKRIISCTRRGKPLYFHGETSGGSRLWSWFETLDGSVPYLFAEAIDFADEDPLGFINLLRPVFESDKTYVLDTPQNRERLPVKAHFLNWDNFVDRLDKASGYTVYHKALATRQAGFDPQGYLNSV